MQPHPVDPSPGAYLRATDVIDSESPAVASLAAKLAGSERGVAAIRRLYEWVRDSVPPTADQGGGPATCRAAEVLAAGTGICYAKSHLLAALLRSVGVPTGLCYQRLRNDPPEPRFVLHALNAVYVESWGAWVRLDARGNRPAQPDGRTAVAAEFTRDGHRLAFPVDPASGEVDDDRVFAEPLRSTVAALRSAADFETLWRTLPDELP